MSGEVESADYWTELFDAFSQAAAACEARARDFHKGSPGRKAHEVAAARIMKLADGVARKPQDPKGGK